MNDVNDEYAADVKYNNPDDDNGQRSTYDDDDDGVNST